MLHVCSLEADIAAGRLPHVGGHALAEAAGREGGVAIGYHPGGKVWDEVKAFQRYDAGSHQVAGREEGVLQIVHYGLVGGGHCCKVVVLDVDDHIEKQQHIEPDEI